MNVSEIQVFERALDAALKRLPSLRCSGAATLELALNVLEMSYNRQSGPFGRLQYGLSILAGRYITATGTREPPIAETIQDLLFASHYYLLREYLYYSYNRPGAITWTRDGNRIRLQIGDQSISRQLYHTANRDLIGSIERFRSYEAGERIKSILRGMQYVTDTSITGELAELLLAEVDLKLSGYYSMLPDDSSVNLGSYTYAEFLCLHKQLLANALFHRYQADIDGKHGVIIMNRDATVERFKATTGLPLRTCAAILNDMVMTASDVRDGVEAVHFALFEATHARIAMAPTHFLLHEGLVSAFRLVAQRNPDHFLKHISGPLSRALNERVRAAFAAHGFHVFSNASLARFDPTLPDIDVLAVSEEKTFGYFIFICETKNPLPPQWAKDQLRAVDDYNIPKGVRQLARITQFLRSDEGVHFLRGLLPPGGLPQFGQNFLIATSSMIVTSHNTGMFIDSSPYPIVEYRALERILERSDGDVLYVNWALKHLDDMADEHARIVTADVDVGPWKITYDVVAFDSMADFGDHTFKSAGIHEQIAKDFIEAGHHPHDVLRDLKEEGDE